MGFNRYIPVHGLDALQRVSRRLGYPEKTTIRPCNNHIFRPISGGLNQSP